ncbi:MAG: PASTA domain-containing protein [Bacilli bacterium]|nr:PASTA domain-containing protein [Bacilli bacterium]
MFKSKQNTRIKIVFKFSLLFLLLIVIKVFYIQVIEYDKLSTLANELWNRNLTIKADRGKILDRNGKVIVDNQTCTGVYIVPSQIKDKQEVSSILSKYLNTTKEDLLSHLNKKTSIERIHPEGRCIDNEISKQIDSHNLDGIYLLKESKRYYKYNNLLSHVVGYTGIDNQGLSGLELKYDNILKGQDGNIKYVSNGKGQKLSLSETYEKEIKGQDIYLTVDLDIQLSLDNELNEAYKKYNADGAIGIVMDSKNGQILAMTSLPSFNPKNYKEYDETIINRNLAIWQNFEPGSTFKIITLAAAINENKVNIFEEYYNDKGSIKIASSTLHCWKRKGHGLQTYLQVVENSCNPGFVTLGNRLGTKTLFNYIKKLGFGKKTGIDLNGEATGILFKEDKVGPVELATTAFGQGISVSAIQQVSSLSAILNNGNLYKPYIVLKEGSKEIKPVLKESNIVTKETSELVNYALRSVVANGSGRNAYIENYQIGGKTGTAQKVGIDGRYMLNNYILSFIGFINDEDNKYVIYIALDNPKGVTQYGGVASAPIAKNVLQDIISIKDIKPKETLPKIYKWDDTMYETIPTLIGKTKKEVKLLLKNFKIEFVGSGETVLDSSPSENTRVKQGSTIKILLN